MSFVRQSISLSLLPLLASCVPIPFAGETYPPAACCRDIVDEQVMGLILPGITTRTEVLLLLGEPDKVWMSERHFEYTSEQAPAVRETHILWAACGAMECGGVASTLTAYYQLAGRKIHVEFDERGRVAKREYVRYERRQDVPGWMIDRGTEAQPLSQENRAYLIEGPCAESQPGAPAENWFGRGKAFMELGQYVNARSCFLRAQEAAPFDQYARDSCYALGLIYELGAGVDQDPEAAKAWYGKAGL